MDYILFDDAVRHRLLPFTHTRPVADIRCGIMTMRERWEHCLQSATATLTEPYLQQVFPTGDGGECVYINGAVFANASLAAAVGKLAVGHKLVTGDVTIAVHMPGGVLDAEALASLSEGLPNVTFDGDVRRLQNIWDIFSLNDFAIRADYALITEGMTGAPVPEGVMVAGSENLFIEEGAHIYPGCIINAATGPVYIGAGAEVLEGTMIRGPLAMCDHAVIKMGAKIYGATTIGPGCKVGGEINNTVFFANSNKAHDGYLGNAVIGEWCNLGADTNCSNLKNNYEEVKIWDEHTNKAVRTGLTFCGLLMADHSKCGINTMFNTGTVVGVSANIFGGSFPEKFIPSFSWGGSENMVTYDLKRALATANRVLERRGKKLNEAEEAMYHTIFNHTARQRQIFNS